MSWTKYHWFSSPKSECLANMTLYIRTSCDLIVDTVKRKNVSESRLALVVVGLALLLHRLPSTRSTSSESVHLRLSSVHAMRREILHDHLRAAAERSTDWSAPDHWHLCCCRRLRFPYVVQLLRPPSAAKVARTSSATSSDLTIRFARFAIRRSVPASVAKPPIRWDNAGCETLIWTAPPAVLVHSIRMERLNLRMHTIPDRCCLCDLVLGVFAGICQNRAPMRRTC